MNKPCNNFDVNKDFNFVQWFVGFVDAEGLFAVHVDKSGLPKLLFRIALHVDDLPVLDLLKKKIRYGIYTKSFKYLRILYI